MGETMEVETKRINGGNEKRFTTQSLLQGAL